LGADDAAALVQGYDRSPHLDAVIEGRGEEIAVGVERATAFLASSARSAAPVAAVYVCGGGARIPGLTDALQQRLRARVELANPLASLRVRAGAFNSLVTDEVAPLLMLPVGLALRQSA
jgi:type IV pilus assembly protein PilM